MFNEIYKLPPWLICVVLAFIGLLKMKNDNTLDRKYKIIAFWTIEAFFLITMLVMVKELF